MRRKVDHRDNLKKKIECQYCKKDTDKRVVIERVPIQDISNELPLEYRMQGTKEFLCTNGIRLKGRNNKWSEGTCENHMIRQLKQGIGAEVV